MEDIEALHRQNTEDGDKQHRTELTRSRVENELKTLQDRIWNTWEMTYAGRRPSASPKALTPPPPRAGPVSCKAASAPWAA